MPAKDFSDRRDFPDPEGCFKAGKPVYDTAHHGLYEKSERPMTDNEAIQWKTFQLHKSLQKIERRESVTEAIIKSDATSWSVTHRVMGTPYPIIEASPLAMECWKALRWYEHAGAISIGFMNYYWLRSRIATAGKNIGGPFRIFPAVGMAGSLEIFFTYRSFMRLQGLAPNDYECMKYGIMETPEKLKEKAEKWSKFAAYKKEWMKRYNYSVFGMRPGEENSLFSACIAPFKPVRYNTRFDYPRRKNPFSVSQTPLKDLNLPNLHNRARDFVFDSPIVNDHPSFQKESVNAHPQEKHRYAGGIA